MKYKNRGDKVCSSTTLGVQVVPDQKIFLCVVQIDLKKIGLRMMGEKRRRTRWPAAALNLAAISVKLGIT
jgi:hypothetical protein